ncbi:hypothetical protein [Halorubrum sp. AJ67]|nr:hypothetical protein [Halorubrum sp. AJ67]CDK37959.1 hypothetical protein BN903_159 [Halorubrum sp. AJ67]
MNGGIAVRDIYLAVDERGRLDKWGWRAADYLGDGNDEFERCDAC